MAADNTKATGPSIRKHAVGTLSSQSALGSGASPSLAVLNAELGARALAGDPGILWELVFHFGPRIRERLRPLYVPPLRPRELHDVTYDAALRLCKNVAKFDPRRGTLFSYYFGYCWRFASSMASSDRVQQRFREKSVPPARLARLAVYEPEAAVQEAPHDRQALAQRELVAQALACLTPREQFVLLADVASREGTAPTPELAQEMGVTPGAVRVLRCRLRKKVGPLLAGLGHALRPSRD
jgi:RNA polymerase sigma factor (sigma-70 family)